MADMVYSMGAHTGQFEEGMARARNALNATEKAAGRTDRALKTSQGGYSQAGRAMLELSRGVEDAASVYGTMGLQGALRASSNNLSQFAAIIHPMAGVVVGLGTALGTILIPKLFGTADAAKESKKELTDWSASINRVKDSVTDLQGVLQRKFDARDIQDMGGEQLEKLKRSTSDELARQQAEMDANLQELRGLAKPFIGDFTAQLEAPIRRSQSPFQEIVSAFEDMKVPDETMKRIRELEQTLFELRGARTGTALKLTDIKAELPEARRRDAEEERAKAAEADRKAREKEEAARKRREQQQLQLDRSLRDEINPGDAAANRIIDTLEQRFAMIDAEFGGDQQMKDRAERSARDQLSRLQSPSGPSFAGSPAALQRGSSAAVGLINRVRNQSVTIAEQQLKEARELNRRIDELVDTARHPADLPPSEFN